MSRSRVVARAVANMSEQEWDGELFRSAKALAKMLGWTSYHTLRSRGSTPGFPDRTLFKDRIIYAELKSETGKPTDRQVAWLDGLAKAGGEVYLWRPSDLEAVGRILSGQWTFKRWIKDYQPPQLFHLNGPWVPPCIWVPDIGRADQAGLDG